MIMIPAFMQRDLLEQGGIGPKCSQGSCLPAAEQNWLNGDLKPKREKLCSEQCIRRKPAAVIAEESSRGMPARDREELNEFLKKHSLDAANIKIDLPPKLPRWGSAELFEGDCIFSVLWCVAPVSQAGVHSLTHPLSDTFLNTTPTSKLNDLAFWPLALSLI